MSGGNIIRMERYTQFNIKNRVAGDSKNYELMNYVTGNDVRGTYKIILCNAPVLTSDMVPIKWIYEKYGLLFIT